jgi:3-oxoacyl-[acyl-carrier protein] reductase
MAELLRGKKALVTGAGRGVGPVIASRLAEEGAAVALSFRSSRSGADEVVARIQAQGGMAVAIQADLIEQKEANILVSEALSTLGGLDIVVNNAAGFGPARLLQDSAWEDLDDEWEAVVKPVFTVTRAALPYLLEQKSGKVVNLSATLLQRPAATYGAHAMAKAAVLAFTRTLAREIGPNGITVNAVSPGMTLTEYSKSLPAGEQTAVRDRTPLRRLAEPEDVANAVLFFCSPLADFVTGSNIAPDGGLAVL